MNHRVILAIFTAVVLTSCAGSGASDKLTLIPYFAWNHRGNVDMTVWFSR